MLNESLSLSNLRAVEELAGPPGLPRSLHSFPSRGPSPLPQPFTVSPVGNHDVVEELKQAKREIERLKSIDPFQAADMAIELQMEKMHLAEATSARDSAVQRLSSAYDSIKEKALTISRLQSEKAELEHRLAFAESHSKELVEAAKMDERKTMEEELNRLQDMVRKLGESAVQANSSSSSPPSEKLESASSLFSSVDDFSSFLTPTDSTKSMAVNALINDIDYLSLGPRPHSVSAFHGPNSAAVPYLKLGSANKPHLNPKTPADLAQARNDILYSLPIPSGIPDDVLNPIIIPPPFTIHEFLGNTTGSLRNSLTGYRVFHEKTTRWCTDREEHGYFFTPLYKCATKPRVPTAHQWSEVDPRCRMTKPTECFYSREGKWYYAGQYIALRLDELSVKEWEELDQETTSMIVRETLAGRKNTSPTVHYEVSQLYAAGALKVSCVGLQCVGFNSGLYNTILEQAAKCQQNGRWKTNWAGPGNILTEFPLVDDADINTDYGRSFDNGNSGYSYCFVNSRSCDSYSTLLAKLVSLLEPLYPTPKSAFLEV